MATTTYRTNLRCTACLEAIRPNMDALAGANHWRVDLNSADKPLTVEGDVSESAVSAALKKAGYELLGPIVEPQTTTTIGEEPPASYYPLILILAYLLLIVGAVEWTMGSFDFMRAMRHFMAGFFIVFSFFKLLDLPGFADAYSMYDVIAARWRGYGLIYPFLELALGMAYLVNFAPVATNMATLVLTSIGTVGVVRTLFQKRKIRCACLGAAIRLPVATVTLLEDAGMAAMAALMLWLR